MPMGGLMFVGVEYKALSNVQRIAVAVTTILGPESINSIKVTVQIICNFKKGTL